MVRTRDPDGVKSDLIISEVQKRACLFDTNDPNYGDRTEKARSWDEVYERVVPGWCALGLPEKFAAGKEVQKRWRSIRDSYTKSYRQGKCVPPEMCAPGTRRYQYHRQMAFLFSALKNKKPRYSQDKYESFSEVSNQSPTHTTTEDMKFKIKNEDIEKLISDTDQPLDLKTKPVIPDRPATMDQSTETDEVNAQINKPVEITIDANSILPNDHFNDDKLFMNSLLPLFKKMDDDTRLFCRIEVLKIIRYALQGHKKFETVTDSSIASFSGIMTKEEANDSRNMPRTSESKLSMVTRSADGTRTARKRKDRSPSPLLVPPKKRGPGRPRKIRPPQSDSDEDQHSKKQKMKVAPVEPLWNEIDEALRKATRVDQLSRRLFMKMYDLAPAQTTQPLETKHSMVHIKTEIIDTEDQPS